MRIYIFLVSFFLVSENIFASEVCSKLKFNRPADMQITDKDLTKDAVLEALVKLRKIVNGDNLGLNEYELFMAKNNALKVVKGHFLLKEAKNERENNANRKAAKKAYCTFLKKEGFWYD